MAGIGLKLERYPDREGAARATAARLQTLLAAATASGGHALLPVSGGSTPIETYEVLSAAQIAWERVTITLTDEREVAPTDQASNERMVRAHLLQGPAKSARFQALESYTPTTTPDAILLGMGTDGHIASIFPDSPQCASALDLAQPADVIRVSTPSSPHPRISLNLSAIVRASAIVLLIYGEAKLACLTGGDQLPVHKLLSHTPVEVIWAP